MLKLNGSFATYNRAKLMDDKVELGLVQIHRGSGWTGGPTYFFYPNEAGEARGLPHSSAGTVRKLLEVLNAMSQLNAE